MISLFNTLLPPPESRSAANLKSISTELLPFIASYYAFAVLVLMRNTRLIRLLLLPIALWFAYCAIAHLDFAKQYPDGRYNYWNFVYIIAMGIMTLRIVDWAIKQKPFVKRARLDHKAHEEVDKWLNIRQLFEDAQDLASDARGIQWKNYKFPKETRPTSSAVAFSIAVFNSLAIHTFISDFLYYALQYLQFTKLAGNSTIFVESLPPLQRYLLSSTISLAFISMLYCQLQCMYDTGTLQGVLLLRQDPALWPPFFDEPWRATSVSEFWSERWHQSFRGVVIPIGFKPLASIAGPIAGVIGAFLVSGLIHEVAVWGFGKGTDFIAITGFFVMMGVGAIIEGIWTQLTGKKVGGIFGWVWTTAWMVFWGNMFVNTLYKAGVFESEFISNGWRPSYFVFGPLPVI